MWTVLWWTLAFVWLGTNIWLASNSYGLNNMPTPTVEQLQSHSNVLKEYKITYSDQSLNPSITGVSLLCEEGVGVGIPGNLFQRIDSTVLDIPLGTVIHFEEYTNPKTGYTHTMSLKTDTKVFFTVEDALAFYRKKSNLIAAIMFLVMAFVPLFLVIRKTFF
ncbi:MAG: hypothetical protein MK212_11590 [Saprospiraceae bacterium]|nr:hypothetical protein [Saprospiraceae bacterium]